ncbi:single-stranded-DNA-specific exonuclease RecJ [Peptoniphilus stercorisuis]|uniref:Single-stranded-DNA-specific exonuclease RecJ n=1 Tax=Peptoniphilus stercorisuis TaxID=1436965 RepID=A0ABS4KBP0_9FIRM|nr:single-stranded-DNA-specific exonuclease RecJ [Peptoniphilus stercorisuis]MBP2025192.1 single-stranded-DNA-specific exonuclease [Peptoniphilus stercorisuis]
MEKWFIKNTKPENIDYEKFNLNKILYKVLVNRDIKTEDEIERYLNPSLEDLNTSLLLPDLIKASNLIMKNIEQNNKIRIVGDYDVDGVMSTYILYNGLLRLNANIDFDIPNRITDGYGINKTIINRAKEDNINLIITCDNGIAAFDAISYAKENNIDIIVTDHHEVVRNELKEEVLPLADAIINPKRDNSKYPFKEICGGVVAYKLIDYLYKINGINEDELYNFLLPYAAIATVCDVMPLINENRIIVSNGLRYLNNTSDIGLSALIKSAMLEDKKIDVYHLGFVLGPTINSSGRLEDASIAIDLLLEKDENKALEKAKYLRGLNVERQVLTDDGYNKIDKQIEINNLMSKQKVLIVYDDDLNESVVGIIAGRIKEKYNRPTIVLTYSNGILKGSGRSIDVYNMFEKVSEHKNLLESFGGHAMACGLSLKKENLEEFINLINKDADLTEEDLIKKVYMDLGLSLSNTDLNLAKQLEKFEPYGTANPNAVFGTKNLKVIRFSVFGKNKNVIKMILTDGMTSREILLFESIDDFILKLSKEYPINEINNMINNLNSNIFLDIVYTPSINSFRGNQNLELKIKNYRVSEGARC